MAGGSRDDQDGYGMTGMGTESRLHARANGARMLPWSQWVRPMMGYGPKELVVAKRQTLKCITVGAATSATLIWSDRESGREVFRFDVSDIDSGLVDKVFQYGVRQIIADGAAAATTLRERIDAMEDRAAKLRDGTWGTREARLADGDIFNAAVAAGLLPDTDAAREKWAKLEPKQRRAIGQRPDVQAHMPEVGGDDVADILAGF